MECSEKSISEKSLWITATPTAVAQTFPFYVLESGRFITDVGYRVKREMHESFLLLYTIKGKGYVNIDNSEFELPMNNAVIIDCREAHEYKSPDGNWEFMWVHFMGSGAESIYKILYPDNEVHSVEIKNISEFENNFCELIQKSVNVDVLNSLDISSKIHKIVNDIYVSTLMNVSDNGKRGFNDDIKSVIAYIEENYKTQITVDDMVDIIHISKYHFIRCFRRTMGTTPYQYLINYRITVAKKMLRTTIESVSEIAEKCGFLDTSNFIAQFKKQTGMKPLEYRRTFV